MKLFFGIWKTPQSRIGFEEIQLMIASKSLIRRALSRRYRCLEGGHPAVSRSMRQGLELCGREVVFDGGLFSSRGRVVLCHASKLHFLELLLLRSVGWIKGLYVGPNVFLDPKPYRRILKSRFVSGVITPSLWVKKFYQARTALQEEKVFVWPAGVDVDYWTPGKTEERDHVLVYVKGEHPESLVRACIDYAALLGKPVMRVDYGNYTLDRYRQLLQMSCAMVCLGTTESQGMYQFESWACDVPTVVMRNDFFDWRGERYEASASPYLSEECGLFFDSPLEIESSLRSVTENSAISPRSYVVEGFSDQAVAKRLLTLF